MAFCLVLSFVISCLAFSIIFTIRKPFNATIRQPIVRKFKIIKFRYEL